MKRLLLIATTGLLVLGAGVVLHIWRGISSATRHLTETRPQQVRLVQGTNSFSFPVVRGRYLLRVGRKDLEPALFSFSIKGYISSQTGRLNLDEDYHPRQEAVSKTASAGGISRSLDISGTQTQVAVLIVATFPEEEGLTCTFSGVK